jgi:high-affinity Fe2+/Pb2+ permease
MEPVGLSVWEIIRLFLIIFAIGGLFGFAIWYFQNLAKRKKARAPSPKEKSGPAVPFIYSKGFRTSF